MSNWRLAVRLFATNPSFCGAVVLILALAIGASTAMFSVIDGVLVRPLPFPDADRLVRLEEGYEGAAPLRSGARLGNVTYHAWKDAGLKTVTAIEGYSESGDALVEDGSERALNRGALITPGLLQMLGASPVAGRLFVAADAIEGAEPVVVISHSMWRDRFGADPEVMGRVVRVFGQAHRVIGVTDRMFAFPDARTGLWVILDIPRPTGPPQNPRFTTFFALARLRSGATPAQAAAEATAIAGTISPKPLAARSTFGEGGAAFVRATPMLDDMTAGVKAALIVIAAGIACILLIACVNVSNLLLSRGASRQRELALRTALGANWGDLARQLVTESLVFSAIGGAVGVLLAFWTIRALPALTPADFPRLDNVQVDVRVLAAAVALSLLTALITSMAPILVTRVDFASLFRGEGASGLVARTLGARARRLILAAQSAFAVVLLVAAVLLARSFVNLVQVDAGYNSEGVIIADVLRPDTTVESAQRYAALMHEAAERARSLPGITAAAIGSMSPLDSNTSLQAFPVPGSLSSAQLGSGTGPAPRTALTRSYAVTPAYEAAMGLRLKSGRFLIDEDATGTDPKWVVNEEFARLYLPENPVGRRFPWRRGNQPAQLEIVGVVGNVLKDGNTAKPTPEFYRILRPAEPFFNYQLIARTNEDPSTAASALTAVIREVAPDATVNAVPLSQRFSESVAQPRFAMTVFATLALVSTSLTAVGLAAALVYGLSLRRREFGVRTAVGATRLNLINLAVREGLTPTAVGILIGIVAALGVTQFMQAILFGVSPLDAASFIAGPLVLIPFLFFACVVPALRASRVDPVVTLRAE